MSTAPAPDVSADTFDPQALCHRCGVPVPVSPARHVLCETCAADPKAAARRLSTRCHRNRLRAYKRGATGFHRPADVRALHRAQRGRCWACGAPLGPVLASPPGYHVDHVLALASGGDNSPANLQLLCITCNIKKGCR